MKRTAAILAAAIAAGCLGADQEGSDASDESAAGAQIVECPASATPELRGYHRVLHHPPSGRVLLFAGYADPSFALDYTDVWAFEPGCGWKVVGGFEPGSPITAGYDAGSDRFVFFVGVLAPAGDTTIIPTSETWVYDLGADAWEMRRPVPAPAGTFGGRFVYDSGSDRLVLYGGEACAVLYEPVLAPTPLGSCQSVDDTWTYDVDTDTWTLMDPMPRPPPLGYYEAAYDAGSDRVIVFGGYGPEARSDETWAYDLDADAWTRMAPADSPSARTYHAMTYDPVRDQVLMFGGVLDPDEAPLNDTWAYDVDADGWTRLDPPSSPSSRGWHDMAYLPGAGRVVLFGGGLSRSDYTDETWFYDPVANDWERAGEGP